MIATAALAAPVTAQPPVRVQSCHVVVDRLDRRNSSVQETIRVSFAVNNGKTADLARFTLVVRREHLRDFTARGSFSDGVVIADRILKADADTQSGFNALGDSSGECIPTYVHFTDGTDWSAAPAP
jgi:hypothetical protein